jgi:hypothetical protein
MITRMVVLMALWLAAMAAILFLAAGDWAGRQYGCSWTRLRYPPAA